jgi:hypothetical protein
VKRSAVVLLSALLFSVQLWALPGTKSKKTDTKKAEAPQIVDSGSFGIFVNGKRVATESFQIHQKEGFSVTSSELKMEDGTKAAQEAELEIMANGDLRKYEWHEVNPTKARATVAPSDNFLIERLTPQPGDKPTELAFILPASTSVVDDYFFSHREILLWRYLATACGSSPNNKCRMEKLQFGVFVPRQQTPTMVSLEYKGREKIQLRGAERELDRVDMTADGLQWSFWVDPADSFKLQRVLVNTEKTEIVRD